MDGRGHRSRYRRRRVAVLATLVALLGLTSVTPDARAQTTVPGGYRVVSDHFVDVGATHVTLRQDQVPQEVHVARLAPALAGRLRVVTAHDVVAGGYETTSGMCLRLRCQLAVNGDFTDLDQGGTVGSSVSVGELMRTDGIRMGLFSLDEAGAPAIGHDLDWSVSLTRGTDEPIQAAGVNRPRAADSLVLYTPRYGASTRTSSDGRELVAELVQGTWGRVPEGGTAVRLAELTVGGDTPLGPNRVVLSGQGLGATVIEELWHRTVTSGERAATLQVSTGGVVEMLGGSPTLVRDGHREFPDNPDDFTRNRHPRTMVGWTAEGELLLVTADGRQPGYSVGMSLGEASDLMLGLGAVEALNLDGGASTTFVVNSGVVNRPSGGPERAVSSALVLLPAPGTVATAAPRSADEACPPREVPPSGFTDVRPGDVHSAAIDCAVWWQLTAGAGSGTYAPTRQVSRGQMASFIASFVLRSGGTLPSSPSDRYPDDGQSVHQININRLAEVGIVSGRGDGTYGPEAPVTRAQMASLLVRAHEHRTGQVLAPTADYFADDANDVHEAAINQLAFAGITGGKSHPHLYGPGDLVQRDQMASFLTRTVALVVSEGHASPP